MYNDRFFENFSCLLFVIQFNSYSYYIMLRISYVNHWMWLSSTNLFYIGEEFQGTFESSPGLSVKPYQESKVIFWILLAL
jgi:hypothetical protein